MASPTASINDIMTGRVKSVEEDAIILTVPGTNYELHLTLDGPGGSIAKQVGKRIRGVIHAEALRIHAAAGGGTFIEPMWGHPRIVAGIVKHVDENGQRVLIDVAVPMWVMCPEGQDMSIITPGELVNCYVHSGARFALAK